MTSLTTQKHFSPADADVAANALAYRLRNCKPKSPAERNAVDFLAVGGGIRGMRARAGRQFSRARAIIHVSQMLTELRTANAQPTLCAEIAQELRELWVDPRFR
jgi:hypothetical protein